MIEQFYSEYGQDEYLDKEIFKGKREGVFVDVGAGDGIKFSNSAFFERFRDWKGLCIEPRISIFHELVKNRICSVENKCISMSGKTERFVEFTGGWLPMLSGIERNFYKEHQSKVKEGLLQKEHNHKMIGWEIATIRLQDLLDKYRMSTIDYCSIDTEGSEMEVLKSINFDKSNIMVFSVENNYNNQEIPAFMERMGYRFGHELGKANVALDQIYIKNKFGL
jgi:FkbM family methyltransferase